METYPAFIPQTSLMKSLLSWRTSAPTFKLPSKFVVSTSLAFALSRSTKLGSAQRIIDYVPLTIEHALNQALSANLQARLWQQLDLAGEGARDRIIALLSENPAIANKRAELELKRGGAGKDSEDD